MLRRTMVILTIVLLSAVHGLSGAAGDGKEEPFDKELKAMAAAWQPVSGEVEGRKTAEALLKNTVTTHDEAGKIVVREGEKVVLEGTVKKIDATKKPRTIDTEITSGENKGKIVLGIYEIEGDTLRICAALPGKGRPKAFSAPAGSGFALTVYKRVKK